MPTYSFEAPDGTIHERYFSVADRPESIEVNGERARFVLSSVQFCVPWQHRAVNHQDYSVQEQEFYRPSESNPGGVSDHDLVKAGKATTADMSRWV